MSTVTRLETIVLLNGPQKFSSIRPDGHEPPGSPGGIPPTAINMSGVSGPSGELCQFTIGSRLRVSGAVSVNIGIITIAGSTSSGPVSPGHPVLFTVSLAPDGQIVAGFTGLPTVQSHVSIDDSVWHDIAVSFQGTRDNQNTLMKLFLDGVLLDEVTLPSQSGTYYPYSFGYVGAQATTPVDFANFVLWGAAVPDDYMDLPTWFTPQNNLGVNGLVAYYDFSLGQLGTMKTGGMSFTPWVGNQGTQEDVSKMFWHLNCASIPPGTSLSMPADNPILETSPGAPFTLMGWMGVEASTGDAVFLSSGSMSITFGYEPAVQKATISYKNKGDRIDQRVMNEIEPSVLHFIALSSDGSTLTMYLDGEPMATTDLSLAPTTISTDAVFCANSSDKPARLQNLVLFDGTMTPHQMEQMAMTTDPQSDSTCRAWLRLNSDLIDVKTGKALIATGTAPTFGEINLPVPKDWQPSPHVIAHLQKRSADEAESPNAMRYKDYIALAKSKGIDTNAPPSGKMKRDLTFQKSVDWYTQTLAASGLSTSLQQKLQASFEKNLAIGIQLSKLAPEAGRAHIQLRDDTTVLTYHDGEEHHELFDLSEHSLALRAEATALQVVKLCADVLGLVLAVLGAVVAARGIYNTFFRAAAQVAEITDEVTPLIQQLPAQGAAIDGDFFKGLLRILGVVRATGLLGTAIYNGIIASWWTFWWTVGSLLLSIVGLIVSFATGGAAAIAMLLIRLSQMAVGIYAIYEDIQAILNPAPAPAGATS